MKILIASLLALSTAAALAQTAPAQPKDGAVVMPSGLRFISLREGTGGKPSATDTVRVNYRGTLASGTEFDSSYKRGEPAQFPLNRVIPCWTEGVQMMRVGGRAHLVCPPQIAYGEKGAGGIIPPNATLDFDIELLGILNR